MIRGRWAICTLERVGGPARKMLTDFMWWRDAADMLGDYREHQPLGLATCASCHGSDTGCAVCNPNEEPLPAYMMNGIALRDAAAQASA